MGRLRMAVIGTGFWGRNHLRVLSELPEVEVVAACDTNPEVAAEAAERYKVRPYTDSREMFKREELDAVTISVWSTELAAEALRALRAEKHVLVEKPMANTAAEAERISKEAEAKSLCLAVGFVERFNPGVRLVKGFIEEERIGRPVSINARRVSKWPERIGDIGVVKDTAIHDIDIARFLFGEDPLAVFAMAGSLSHRFEDYAQVMLSFPSGRSAFLEANWLTPYKVRRLMVTGSEAIVSLNYITQETTVETAESTNIPRFEWREPLRIELQHFVDCVLRGGEPEASGLDGVKALRVAEAALRSAAKGRLVKLSG